MSNFKVVSISGLKGSGKGVLADVLINIGGYERSSFATPLKLYLCNLYGWDFSRMGDLEYKEEKLCHPVLWSSGSAMLLKALADIPSSETIWFEDKWFYTRREALQYIGTEVLRRYDTDFHVKKWAASLQENGKYVSEDTRFPNELNIIKAMNGLCVFVDRPSIHIDSTFQHASETSLTKADFEHILINDGTKEDLIQIGQNFFGEKGYL